MQHPEVMKKEDGQWVQAQYFTWDRSKGCFHCQACKRDCKQEEHLTSKLHRNNVWHWLSENFPAAADLEACYASRRRNPRYAFWGQRNPAAAEAAAAAPMVLGMAAPQQPWPAPVAGAPGLQQDGAAAAAAAAAPALLGPPQPQLQLPQQQDGAAAAAASAADSAQHFPLSSRGSDSSLSINLSNSPSQQAAAAAATDHDQLLQDMIAQIAQLNEAVNQLKADVATLINIVKPPDAAAGSPSRSLLRSSSRLSLQVPASAGGAAPAGALAPAAAPASATAPAGAPQPKPSMDA